MEKKCPFCGAETRPGDNFCLNCGNRLLPASSSSPFPQTQPGSGEATIAAPEDWAASMSLAPAPSGGNWPDIGGATVAATNPGSDMATYREPTPPVAQAMLDRIEQPARLILCAETGEVLQEYPLDKPEITIGRAPNSDILLSKDKLTSRRHATVLYENHQYTLRDERSANGTFVNGQQLEEMGTRLLQDGDHVGIGEHELIFRAFGSPGVEDLPTVAVPFDQIPLLDKTSRTVGDDMMTIASPTNSDDYVTKDASEFEIAVPVTPDAEPTPALSNGAASNNISAAPIAPPIFPVAPVPETPVVPPPPPLAPVLSVPPHLENLDKQVKNTGVPAPVSQSEGNVTLNTFTSLAQPSLPDITALLAALSTLDGQVMALQEQLNATQEAVRNHETEIAQTSDQLRSGLRSVCERMDGAIASVARNREALAWGELQQLVDDVINSPHIEYVAKLAKKARDLNRVFQVHQSVLSTMAECNSLLRGLIGEDK